MSVAIEKLDAVESVKVSLNDGTASVVLRAGNSFDPEQLRKIARDSGFTPKQAKVRVVGRLLEKEGVAVLEVSGPELGYVLAETAGAPGQLFGLRDLVGREVIVEGVLPERPAKANPARLLRIVSVAPLPVAD